MFIHQNKDGRMVKLSELELSQLDNIRKSIDEMARNGMTIRYAGSLNSVDDIWCRGDIIHVALAEDIWYGENKIFDKRVKVLLNYYEYVEEYYKRIRNLTNHNV